MPAQRLSLFPLRIAAVLACLLLLVAGPAGAQNQPPGLPTGPNSPSGGVYLPEWQISTPAIPDPDRYHPAIAYNYNRGQYLVVWHNTWPSGRDIYRQRVSNNGEKVGPWFAISAGANDRLQPAVAYNGYTDEYLVVFMYDELGDGQKYNIWGQRVRWDGVMVGASFEIETWPNRSFWSPRVLWNIAYDEYWVMWDALDQATQQPTDVSMKIYNSEGEYQWFFMIASAGFPSNADFAYDPLSTRSLIVWNAISVSGTNTVRGFLRHSNGNPDGSDFLIQGDASKDILFPRVAAANTSVVEFLRFVVVYEYVNSSTDHDIYMAWVHPTTGLVGTFPLVNSADNETHPVIAGSDRRIEYMIVYQLAGATGARIIAKPFSNFTSSDPVELCNYVFWDCFTPEVAYGRVGFMTTYIGDSIGDPGVKQHIYGRLFHTEALYAPLMVKSP